MTTTDRPGTERAALDGWIDAEKASSRAAFVLALSVAKWSEANGFMLPAYLRDLVADFDALWAHTIEANAAWIALHDAARKAQS